MKKTLILLTMICVVLMPAASLAETITWSEVGEPFAEQAGLEGEFYSLSEMGLAIWLPDDLYAVEPAAEDAAAGRYALFTDEAQECFLAIDTIHVDGMTLNQAYDNAVASGMKEPEIVNVNGLDTLSYLDETNNLGCIVLVDTNCNMIIFSLTPCDSEAAQLVFTVIGSSIMPLE